MKLPVASAALALLPLVGCGRPAASGDSPRAAKELVVRRAPLLPRTLLSGEIEAASGEAVSVPQFPTWQTTLQWLAEDGTRVVAGERVALLDAGAFGADLEEKRSAVSAAGHELERQKSLAAEAEASARLAVVRARIALEKASLRVGLPEEIRANRNRLQDELARDRAAIDLRKARAAEGAQQTASAADLRLSEIALLRAKRAEETSAQALRAAELRAPSAGIFVVSEHPWERRKLQLGDRVFVGMTIGTIPDLATLRVLARLPDVDEGRVRPGDAAEVRLDSFPDRAFPARLAKISGVAQELSRDSLRRAFAVEVALDRLDPSMRPGFSVRVEVASPPGAPVLLAPREALDLASAPQRARLAAGSFREVTLGECTAAECVVLAGLAEGERLAPAAGGAGG